MQHTPLVHVTQPTGLTCTSACLAMITFKPVQDVVLEFDAAYNAHDTTPAEYLESLGYHPKRYYTDSFNELEPGHIYLLTVPSVNLNGLLHHVVLDFRDELDPVVLDPSRGREGKRYYVLQSAGELKDGDDDFDPLATPMVSWIVDLSLDFGVSSPVQA